jgi:triacylglycerol lipase
MRSRVSWRPAQGWLARGRLAGLSPRRRMFIAGASLVVAAAAILGGLKAAGAFTPAAARPNPSVPGVVVLVPGYGGSTAGVDVLAAHIRGLGMSAEVVTLPGNGTGDLGAQAVVLNGYVSRALRSGAGQVDVVGYSAGGVVTRLWDEQDAGAQKVRRIITLGSPLNGTRIAAAGNAADPTACPLACQELVPGSTLLTRLRSVPLGRAPGWLSLWTTDDQTVRPPDSARLAGAVNVPLQSVCPGVMIQHSQLPTSPLVIGIVLRALGSGPLTAPGPADCAALQALGQGPALGPG